MKDVLRKNWFLIGIAVALLLGFLIPNVGVTLNRRSIFTTTLIVALFLISGLKLPSESIRAGLKNARIHLFIQGFIFVLTPLYFFVTARFFSNALDGALVIGSEVWNADSFGTVWLTEGPHNIQVVHREDGQWADVEVAAARGETADLENFRLIGSGDSGRPGLWSIVPGLDPFYEIHIYQSDPGESAPVTNLAEAYSAMDKSFNDGTFSLIRDDQVNHSDPDNRGNGNNAFGSDHDYPFDQAGNAGADDDDFAIYAFGHIYIQTPGTYYIGFNSDDGAQLTIYGGAWNRIIEDATGLAQITTYDTPNDTLSTDVQTGWSWTVGEITFASDGYYEFDLLTFDRGDGAFVELFGGSERGVYGLLMQGYERTITKPAVAPALELVSEEPWCRSPVVGDLNNDCKNDFLDFAIKASHWLGCNRLPASACQ